MKIQPDHAAAARGQDNIQHRANALHAGHSNMRYRWDCLHRARITRYICDTIYPTGANDAHIDTVLRRAIPDLNQTTTKGANNAS